MKSFSITTNFPRSKPASNGAVGVTPQAEGNDFNLPKSEMRRMQPLIKSKALVATEGPATAPDTRAVPSDDSFHGEVA